jgi:hypothetical protein
MIDKRINVQNSFNTNFCTLLEYHLSNAFGNSPDNVLKYYWCDGIDKPVINQQFTSNNITSIKLLTTRAWTGDGGQHRYDMVIKLGRCSRRKALKGLDLADCLPDVESLDWVDIDVLNGLVILQLK